MNATQQAIEDAQEGDWRHPEQGLVYDFRIEAESQQVQMMRESVNGSDYWDDVFHVSEALLDPTFWQALGKTRKWHTKKYNASGVMVGWFFVWHALIDHLEGGKDINSYRIIG